MWESTPIVNKIWDWTDEEKTAFQSEMMAIHMAPRTIALGAYKREEWIKTVYFYKAIFGQQDYTWVGEYRFWIWERNGWRVYVSNIQGVSFEVQADLNKEQTRAAWDDFRARIGLYCPYAVGQRVLTYSTDEPATVLGLCELYPGHVLVRLDKDGATRSIHFDNMVSA